MRYDLHVHSYYSDGCLSPIALVQRAVEQQVNVLALTDHDTVAGIAEAQQAATELPIKLIPGIELSATWGGQTIHIVGLVINKLDNALQACLDQLKQQRMQRAQKIIEQLTHYGIPGLAEAMAQRVQGVPGRLHVARYLVEKQYAKTPGKAFKHFLAKGRPGYVPTQWLTVSDAIALIHGAGGIAVLAHPMRYKLTFNKLEQLVKLFAEQGGQGIEVATSSQRAHEQQQLAHLVDKYQLYASIGSDFHEPCAYNELGKAAFAVQVERFIWQILPAL